MVFSCLPGLVYGLVVQLPLISCSACGPELETSPDEVLLAVHYFFSIARCRTVLLDRAVSIPNVYIEKYACYKEEHVASALLFASFTLVTLKARSLAHLPSRALQCSARDLVTSFCAGMFLSR